MKILVWLKRQWTEWQDALRWAQEERRRHDEECISVPLSRHCDLLQAEERSKIMAVNLAASIEARMQLQATNNMLCAVVYSMTEEQRVEGIQNVARLELVAPARKGFDS